MLQSVKVCVVQVVTLKADRLSNNSISVVCDSNQLLLLADILTTLP